MRLSNIALLLAACVMLAPSLAVAAEPGGKIPSWVVYPGKHWLPITPAQAGLDPIKFEKVVAKAHTRPGTWGGIKLEDKWGAVLTRGGYLVHTWGDPKFKFQSASLGKCITRALVGLSVERAVIKLDEPIQKTWTGRGQLSHPHKYLDTGHHAKLTWRQLLNHQGGFILESGYHWRTGEGMGISPGVVFRVEPPKWVKWTKDPLFDNYAHTDPGRVTQYSSGGYWRLGQALTAAWNKDLKQVLDEELFSRMDIPADRWDWMPGKVVHDTKDFYPAYPGYGDYVDPPYEINGHVVRGAPGWVVMSSQDLARFGLLIATGGVWKGKRLIGPEWVRGHAGLDVHVVAGDRETFVSIAKICTKDFPFGKDVSTEGTFAFPKDLIVGPVSGPGR